LKKKVYGAHQKNLNEDRPILSAAKYWTVILVSRNIRYMRIFAGVPRGGGVKYKKCYAYVQPLNMNTCLLLIYTIESIE